MENTFLFQLQLKRRSLSCLVQFHFYYIKELDEYQFTLLHFISSLYYLHIAYFYDHLAFISNKKMLPNSQKSCVRTGSGSLSGLVRNRFYSSSYWQSRDIVLMVSCCYKRAFKNQTKPTTTKFQSLEDRNNLKGLEVLSNRMIRQTKELYLFSVPKEAKWIQIVLPHIKSCSNRCLSVNLDSLCISQEISSVYGKRFFIMQWDYKKQAKSLKNVCKS